MKKRENTKDTIAAISTPFGLGGLCVVRISGPSTESIVQRLFAPRRNVDKMATHTLYYGAISTGAIKGEQVMTAFMRAPHSYTGEDVVEISAHGGMLVAKHLLSLILQNGARLALPGEFTKRAFLNGKMDLNQAEAVADIISAKTDKELAIAINQAGGKLTQKIKSIISELLDLLSEVEAGIDFSEEQIEFISRKQIAAKSEDILSRIVTLQNSYKQGKILKEGIKIAIIGRPNVGKSSLLNCLLKEEKAIVSSIPGTTRDIVEDFISIRNIPVHLLDTAGLRRTNNDIEKKGLLKTEKAITDADLILWLVDGSRRMKHEDFYISKKLKGKTCIGVINKVDLPQKITKNDIRTLDNKTWIELSAKTAKGLKKLEEIIELTVWNKKVEGSKNDLIITSQRQRDALQQAQVCLKNALKTERQELSSEFIAIDVRKCIASLNEITGDVIKEDVLDRIFSNFCIGK